MTGGADLGKIVSLIMENPKLIEEISNLGKSTASPEEKLNDAAAQSSADESQKRDEPAREAAEAAVELPQPRRTLSGKNRSQLLGALKPYVSRDRAQAIDSMLTIVEILDAMKGR